MPSFGEERTGVKASAGGTFVQSCPYDCGKMFSSLEASRQHCDELHRTKVWSGVRDGTDLGVDNSAVVEETPPSPSKRRRIQEPIPLDTEPSGSQSKGEASGSGASVPGSKVSGPKDPVLLGIVVSDNLSPTIESKRVSEAAPASSPSASGPKDGAAASCPSTQGSKDGAMHSKAAKPMNVVVSDNPSPTIESKRVSGIAPDLPASSPSTQGSKDGAAASSLTAQEPKDGAVAGSSSTSESKSTPLPRPASDFVELVEDFHVNGDPMLIPKVSALFEAFEGQDLSPETVQGLTYLRAALEMSCRNQRLLVTAVSSCGRGRGGRCREQFTVGDPLKCRCGQSFSRAAGLQRHKESVCPLTPDSEKTAFDCSKCRKTFTVKATCQRHEATCGLIGTESCPHCERTFTGKPRLLNHIRKVHPEMKEESR